MKAHHTMRFGPGDMVIYEENHDLLGSHSSYIVISREEGQCYILFNDGELHGPFTVSVLTSDFLDYGAEYVHYNEKAEFHPRKS